MAWYSSAMYLGIAIAPPLGNESLALGGPWLVPVTGALVTAIALVLFLAGFRARRMRRLAASGAAPTDAAAPGAGTQGATLPVPATTASMPLPDPRRP
jgi:hypothetical protein